MVERLLQAMVEAGANPSLSKMVRLLAVGLVAFAGFLRCDDLIKLRCKDVSFNGQGMVIKVSRPAQGRCITSGCTN